ncbi:hypothetical protein DV737_g334, partial [Chaetothyriales sp. CBS 132003]
MSSSHALSDDQASLSLPPVASELKKMTAFIRQEAEEKKREIELKADEEFAIEKSKLVREETAAIDAEYEQKFKQAALSQQTTRSTFSNKTRLKVLGARQALLDKLYEETRSRLTKEAAASKGYEETLKGLLLEGLYLLNESEVVVRARKQDKDKVAAAAKKAAAEFEKETKRKVKTTIDEANWLPADSAGGIFLANANGKIEINNTFEERLGLLETDALPQVRATLFGENENRKFHD